MENLNYHHLLYFWTVASEGTIAQASKKLFLAPQTISGQIRKLEQNLGVKLFRRSGRRIVLTDDGRRVLDYADSIFSLGRELEEDIRGGGRSGKLILRVGVGPMVHKLIAFRLLEPVFQLDQEVRILASGDGREELLDRLENHGLDMILCDAPIPSHIQVHAFNHFLGECPMVFMGVPKLARSLRPGFPGSLEGAPVLLPQERTVLRTSLDRWIDAKKVVPEVRGEFSDTSLLKAVGQAGVGIFAVPRVIEKEVRRQYGVERVGVLDGVRETFYAISPERRIHHPAVVVITQTARERLLSKTA